MNWTHLPKKDKKHLRENSIIYKWQFSEQVTFMKKEIEKFHKNEPNIVCWDCVSIARKLGMWNNGG